MNFRNRIIKVTVTAEVSSFELEGDQEMSIRVFGERQVLKPGEKNTVANTVV